MVFRLIYSSKSSEGVGESDFRAIAMFSALNNLARGVTGLLLTHNEEIMQVLEGEESEVRALYTKIEKDKRHHSVKIIVEREVEKTEFASWSMGYRPLDTPIDMDIFFALSRESLGDVIAENSELQNAAESFADKSGLS